jgi:hypothetical protein
MLSVFFEEQVARIALGRCGSASHSHNFPHREGRIPPSPASPNRDAGYLLQERLTGRLHVTPRKKYPQCLNEKH